MWCGGGWEKAGLARNPGCLPCLPCLRVCTRPRTNLLLFRHESTFYGPSGGGSGGRFFRKQALSHAMGPHKVPAGRLEFSCSVVQKLRNAPLSQRPNGTYITLHRLAGSWPGLGFDACNNGLANRQPWTRCCRCCFFLAASCEVTLRCVALRCAAAAAR